ncbi:MAG: LPS-assembly protein LptD [Aquificaceae bacterium]|nr:LPS-assembly protein LptD [Aquificaceae bacterium]
MLFFLYFFLFLSSCSSFALDVLSWSLERLPDGSFKAEGDVEAYYRSYYIRADFMTYDPTKRTVYARGNVYVRSLDARLEARGKEAFLDLERDTGYFIDAEGRFEKFNFTAGRLDKYGESYVVEQGSITTCPPQKKEMSLCFSRANISQRYVFSQRNTLKLFDVPIAYLPVSFFPVGERRSGLLPPTIGSNTYNNFLYQQPIYWAISKDKDATFTLDLRDRQAKGLSLEYRQSMRKPLDLMLNASFYKEPEPPGRWWQGRSLNAFRENRYRLKWDLDLGDLKAGVDLLSDPYFMQDVYLTTRERTLPYLTSYLSYRRDEESYLFNLSLWRFYDTTMPDNKKTLQRLPEANLYLKERNLFNFLYFNLNASYTNFYRQEGLRSHRLLAFPELSLPKRLFAMNFLSTVTMENLFYLDTKGGDFKDKSILASFRYRESLPFFFNLRHGGIDTKNILELSYSYRPKTYNNPRFDNWDQINKENALRYTLRSYGQYKERLLYILFMEGGYNHLGRFNYLGQEVKEKILPVRTVLWLYPIEWLRLSSDTNYDPVNGRFLKAASSLTFTHGGNGLTLGRTLEKKYDGSRLNDQYSLSANVQYRATSMIFSLVRDNRVNKDIQRQLSFDYRGACWSFGLLLRDIYDGTRQKYTREAFLVFNVFDLQRFTMPLKR